MPNVARLVSFLGIAVRIPSLVVPAITLVLQVTVTGRSVLSRTVIVFMDRADGGHSFHEIGPGANDNDNFHSSFTFLGALPESPQFELPVGLSRESVVQAHSNGSLP